VTGTCLNLSKLESRFLRSEYVRRKCGRGEEEPRIGASEYAGTVHLVRGRLSVESEPGAGTRIIVLVPGADENHGEPTDAGSDEIVSATGIV
jgi:hypothetical protein